MTRYLRFRPVPRRITFVRMTVLRAFDSQGRNCRIEHHMTQVSLEEVDRALATAPHQVLIFGMDPEAHRPLTASSLVRSCDYDRHEGQISRMVQTSYGRGRCRVFAVWGGKGLCVFLHGVGGVYGTCMPNKEHSATRTLTAAFTHGCIHIRHT